jgi:hypothetical protein
MTDPIKALESRVQALETTIAALKAVFVGGSAGVGGAGGEVATDRELDSQYGDEQVRKSPKKWLENGGHDYKGYKLSQCPADFLEEFASLQDWMASKDDESGKMYQPKGGKAPYPMSRFGRKTARLARGWAKRIREGWKPKALAPMGAESKEPDAFAQNGGSFGDDDGGDPFASADFVSGDDDIPFIVDAARITWRRP